MRFRLRTLLNWPTVIVAFSLATLIAVAVCTYRFFWWFGALAGYEQTSNEPNIPWSGS